MMYTRLVSQVTHTHRRTRSLVCTEDTLIDIDIDINPRATDAQVLRVGHYAVAGFAVFVAAFATMLHGVNIDLGFIYVSSNTNNVADT